MMDLTRFSDAYEYSNNGIKYRLYTGKSVDYFLTKDDEPIPAGMKVSGGRYPNQTGLKILHVLWEAEGGYVSKSRLIEQTSRQRKNAHGKDNPNSRIKTQLTYLRHLFEKPRLIERRSGFVADETCYRFNGVIKKFRLNEESQESTDFISSHVGIPSTAAQLEGPGGSMDLTSQFYIERDCDRSAAVAVRQQNFTMAIKGPRQVGKSSLLTRVHNAALQQGKHVAYLDFQTFDEDAFADLERFLTQFCVALSYELGLVDMVHEYWPANAGNKNACRRYVKDQVLKQLDAPLVLLLDEVDMIFHTTFCNDFFGMLRSWHNERARSPEFRRLNMAIVTSTEPKLFISDPNQSPFNVAEPKIEPEDFTPLDVKELNRRYGNPLKGPEVDAAFLLLGGHPYLTRLLLHLVATARYAFDTLCLGATSDDGPFADHLSRLLSLLEMKSELNLKQAYVEIIKNKTCDSEEALVRLKGAGLIRDAPKWAETLRSYFPDARQSLGSKDIVLPRCELYAKYFRRCLSG